MAVLKNRTDVISESGVQNEEDFVSFETRQMLDTINYVFICGFIGLFGIITNSMNIVVFCRQGFKNTMTISFMALAISDIGCLVTLELFCLCLNPLFSVENLDFVPLELIPPIGGCPHVTFARITGWITTYVTAERCLCITAPLAVRRIITPKRTTIILFIIYAVNIATVLPDYATSYIGWKFYPDYNRSLVGLILTSDNETAQGAVYFIQAVLVLSYFMCVTVLTAVLVVKLKGASRWRNNVAQSKDTKETLSPKDKKATKMVVTISSLLIILYSPNIILSFASFCEPKFGLHGAYTNLFFAIWSFGFIFNSLNSSINIFMYYNMSTKYREIFREVFLLNERKAKVLPVINTGGKDARVDKRST